MEKQENRLINGKIAPVLLEFALPFMLASFLQPVYGAVDLFVVGRYTGSAAVSAVSIGSRLMLIAAILVQGICMGGAGRRRSASAWCTRRRTEGTGIGRLGHLCPGIAFQGRRGGRLTGRGSLCGGYQRRGKSIHHY